MLLKHLFCDRIKSTLPEHCLKHVLSVESTLGKPFWLQPDKLVQVIDQYVSNLGTSPHVTSSFIGHTRRFSVQNANETAVQNDAKPDGNRGSARFHDPSGKPKQCFNCGSFSHLRAQCDRGKDRGKDGHGQRFKRVNASTADQSRGQSSLAGSQQVAGRPIVAACQSTDQLEPTVSAGVNKVAVADDILALFTELDDTDNFECTHVKTVNVSEQFDIHRIVADCQSAMHYVRLDITDTFGNAVKMNSLFDSGTQVSILKADAVEQLSCTLLGKVTLQTFDNRVSTGDLVSLNVKLDCGQRYHPIRFVVCDNVSHDCLLSLADYRNLLDSEARSAESRMTAEEHCDPVLGVANVDNDIIDDANDNQTIDADSNTDFDCDNNDDDDGEYADITSFAESREMINPDNSQVNELIHEQACDQSLSGAFTLARNGKGGYFLRNGLLFHRAQMQGKDVDRVVVPVGRRLALLNLAHDQVGCHMGIRKTKQRPGRLLLKTSLTIAML